MRRVALGCLEVSVIGLGCNNMGRALDQEGSTAVVDAALEAGVNFFDTARNYGNGQSESFLGAALGSRRDQAVVATKFGVPVADGVDKGGARPEYVRSAIEKSLGELNTDYIDLYQLHFPDPETPIGDTLDAMWQLIEQGKVREIGCSNLNADQFAEALAYSADRGGRPLVSDQVEYSLLHREPQENGLTEFARANNVGVLPYYPLKSGLLTGKAERGQPHEGRLAMDRYQSFLTDRNYDLVDRVKEFAAARDLTMVQVALGWLIAQPEVPAVTPGATRSEQVRANAMAAEWSPSPDDLAMLDAITAP